MKHKLSTKKLKSNINIDFSYILELNNRLSDINVVFNALNKKFMEKYHNSDIENKIFYSKDIDQIKPWSFKIKFKGEEIDVILDIFDIKDYVLNVMPINSDRGLFKFGLKSKSFNEPQGIIINASPNIDKNIVYELAYGIINLFSGNLKKIIASKFFDVDVDKDGKIKDYRFIKKDLVKTQSLNNELIINAKDFINLAMSTIPFDEFDGEKTIRCLDELKKTIKLISYNKNNSPFIVGNGKSDLIGNFLRREFYDLIIKIVKVWEKYEFKNVFTNTTVAVNKVNNKKNNSFDIIKDVREMFDELFSDDKTRAITLSAMFQAIFSLKPYFSGHKNNGNSPSKIIQTIFKIIAPVENEDGELSWDYKKILKYIKDVDVVFHKYAEGYEFNRKKINTIKTSIIDLIKIGAPDIFYSFIDNKTSKLYPELFNEKYNIVTNQKNIEFNLLGTLLFDIKNKYKDNLIPRSVIANNPIIYNVNGFGVDYKSIALIKNIFDTKINVNKLDANPMVYARTKTLLQYTNELENLMNNVLNNNGIYNFKLISFNLINKTSKQMSDVINHLIKDFWVLDEFNSIKPYDNTTTNSDDSDSLDEIFKKINDETVSFNLLKQFVNIINTKVDYEFKFVKSMKGTKIKNIRVGDILEMLYDKAF